MDANFNDAGDPSWYVSVSARSHQPPKPGREIWNFQCHSRIAFVNVTLIVLHCPGCKTFKASLKLVTSASGSTAERKPAIIPHTLHGSSAVQRSSGRHLLLLLVRRGLHERSEHCEGYGWLTAGSYHYENGDFQREMTARVAARHKAVCALLIFPF